MMVARTFVLITDCLVCMGSFFLWFDLYLVFSGVFMFCRFMCESGEPASNPPRLRSFFLRFCALRKSLAVLEFAARRSPYDDALSTR